MDKKQVITACVLLHKDGKVLIGKRALTKSFLPGKWELPGGHVEFGETVRDCLERELIEEFNIEIILGEPFAEFTYLMNEGRDHVIEVLYFAQMKNPDQKIPLNRIDHEEHAWIAEDEVDKYYAKDDDEGNVVRKGFESLKINS